ncbi:MAG: DEAD/DEAH box helicase, partial [Cyanobacteria bacterium P01_F01_bin.53]
MQILHGTWIPDINDDFVQAGNFYLWVETQKVRRFKKGPSGKPFRYTRQLQSKELAAFLEAELGFSDSYYDLSKDISPKFFQLPTAGSLKDAEPLPSLEMARYLETDLPKAFSWQTWQIDCYKIGRWFHAKGIRRYPSISAVLSQLKELHFIAQYQLAEVQIGADLLFWYHYTQAFKSVILKDQYIPALKYRRLAIASTSGNTRLQKARSIAAKVERKMTIREGAEATLSEGTSFAIYPHWEIVGEAYEDMIQRYVEHMPLVCCSGFSVPSGASSGVSAGASAKKTGQGQLYEPETLLRHFSECLLYDVIARTPRSQAFEKKIVGSFIHSALQTKPWLPGTGLETYQQWQVWRDRITRTQSTVPFYFCFHLESPAEPDAFWQLNFKVAPKEHPSLRISLEDYWQLEPHQQMALKLQLGENFEKDLLLTLGDAARIYTALWVGLETDEPIGIELGVDAAFDFLKEAAWVLEDAGYKVIVPAWWTPQGRRRAQLKLRASSKSLGANDKAKSYFSIDTLVEYQYELSIGGEKVSASEWQQLVNAKTPLVQFRGEWIELDQAKMQEMMTFWQKHQKDNPGMGLLEFMQMAASQGDEVELDFSRDRTLLTMMDKLNRTSAIVPIKDPKKLQGSLRDYQKRGVSWLQYLESLGLNGCLADDMGLGKTVQVIARLVQEEEQAKTAKVSIPPTLLIAPTSVLGNWNKELERFAPHLKAVVHHGGDRVKTKKEFKQLCKKHNLIITSFSLARRDSDLLDGVAWHRIVLDEAQNIKNPKAAQTKAILKLSGQHRLALTGTPVENRLLDLWSIFNFLNPGYLGKQAKFRKNFELPIQRNNDKFQATVLKRLVEPFILRRVKTDEAIIKDLPEKVEQKLYCNLTKEQASLYVATVRDVEKQLKDSEGIQRKGIILSTLMKLKQICNHPRQFLQDDSDFTPERSHKLSRLTGMVSEAMADGDSLLIFTQFKEIGDALEQYLHHTHHYNTYYLHGGTTRKKRERMMDEFQSPETGPSIFILSLKAGGVGITLTKANHVFHFDRWWNPAVEDQATDRAFRIGQKKNVFVHKFVTIGTLEERIDQMIEDKKKLAGSIVGSDESWLTELDNTAFKKLIALKRPRPGVYDRTEQGKEPDARPARQHA